MLGYDVEKVEGAARIPRRAFMITQLPRTSFEQEAACSSSRLPGPPVVLVFIGKNRGTVESE